jgi:DNA-binding XRE family transcriptional regulator
MQRRNNVRTIRESRLLGRTELARLAGLSPLTIDRIEKGMSCRLQTQRKILLALGFKTSHKSRVFRQ